MAVKQAVFYPARVNMYVPNMKFAADIQFNSSNLVQFGAPAAAATIHTSGALTTGVAATFLNLGLTNADIWGRGLSVVASAPSTRTFQVRGRDYLGQPMTFTGSLNGATPVDIPKAFKYVDRVDYGASADVVSVTLSTSGKLGLPYATIALIASLESASLGGGLVTATLGTLTTRDLTTPGTGITSDPRGLYVPNGSLNGTRVIAAQFMYAFADDSLHGVQHFFS